MRKVVTVLLITAVLSILFSSVAFADPNELIVHQTNVVTSNE